MILLSCNVHNIVGTFSVNRPIGRNIVKFRKEQFLFDPYFLCVCPAKSYQTVYFRCFSSLRRNRQKVFMKFTSDFDLKNLVGQFSNQFRVIFIFQYRVDDSSRQSHVNQCKVSIFSTVLSIKDVGRRNSFHNFNMISVLLRHVRPGIFHTTSTIGCRRSSCQRQCRINFMMASELDIPSSSRSGLTSCRRSHTSNDYLTLHGRDIDNDVTTIMMSWPKR